MGSRDSPVPALRHESALPHHRERVLHWFNSKGQDSRGSKALIFGICYSPSFKLPPSSLVHSGREMGELESQGIT